MSFTNEGRRLTRCWKIESRRVEMSSVGHRIQFVDKAVSFVNLRKKIETGVAKMAVVDMHKSNFRRMLFRMDN